MATVIDLLRQLGHGEGPGRADALCGPIELPAAVVPTLGVAMPRALVTGWTELSGRQTTAEHALAAAASRAGESICFAGRGNIAHEDLLLLMAADLAFDPSAGALWLVPDQATAARDAASFDHLLPLGHISSRAVSRHPGRDGPARLVVATYDELHARLLPFADRGWKWLWADLAIVGLPDLQCATGTLGNHLLWLIRRTRRLARRNLRCLAAATGEFAGEFAGNILGEKCRAIESRASRPAPTLVALWRSDDRLRAVGRLASELAGRGLAVTVLGRDVQETAMLAASNTLPSGIVAGLGPATARVALVVGVPTDADSRDAILQRGYRLVVMMAGDEPHEQILTSEPALLSRTTPLLPLAMGNPYVAACHLQAAASELPVTPLETDRWQAGELVERLDERGLLRSVAGMIYPGESSTRISSDLLAAQIGAAPVSVRDPLGVEIIRLLPSVADWRGLPGSTWESHLSVTNRSDEPPAVDLAVDERPGLTLPELTLEVTLRENLETRSLQAGTRTFAVSSAKVHVHQTVDGLREYVPGAAPASLRLGRPLTCSWTARAVALPLPTAPPDPPSAGWALLTALPLVARIRPGDLLATYDRTARLLWLIESEPGGSGITEIIISAFGRLLELADILARACLGIPRYAAVARSEGSWLDALYGREPAHADVAGQSHGADSVAGVTQARRELFALPQHSRRSRVYQAPSSSTSDQVESEARSPSSAEVRNVDADQEQSPQEQHSALQQPEILPERPQRVEDRPQTEVGPGPEAPSEPRPTTEPKTDAVETAIDDVRWDRDSVYDDAGSDDVTWQPELEDTEVEDIAWEAEAPLTAADTPVQPGLPEVPPLGQESSVPLNAQRRSGRYAALRRSHAEGRPGPATRRGAEQPPKSFPPAPRPERAPASAPPQNRPVPDPPPAAGEPAAVDVGAMIARMRRLRAERERDRTLGRPVAEPRSVDDEPTTLRFQPGQHVYCVPYGEGIVRRSQLVDGREQLSIEFPQSGVVQVDAAVSAVRHVRDAAAQTDTDDEN